MRSVIVSLSFLAVASCADFPQEAAGPTDVDPEVLPVGVSVAGVSDESMTAGSDRPGMATVTAGPNVKNRCRKRRTTGSNLRKQCDSKSAQPVQAGPLTAPPPRTPTAGTVRPN